MRRFFLSEFEERVLELLKKIDEKLDKVLAAGSKAAAPATPTAKVTIESAPTVKPSAVAEKQEEEEKLAKGEIKPDSEIRRVCPKCGSTEFNAVPDKSKVMHYVASTPIYAKKNVCRKCGAVVL